MAAEAEGEEAEEEAARRLSWSRRCSWTSHCLALRIEAGSRGHYQSTTDPGVAGN